MAKQTLIAMRRRIREFRDKRELVKSLGAEVSKDQVELIASMKNVDPMNMGITYNPEDKNKGTAYVQQNKATEFWDEEAIHDYIGRKVALRKKVTTCILDMGKWEAEVAAGNVPASIAKKLKKMGSAPKPFIRFGKAGENSNV